MDEIFQNTAKAVSAIERLDAVPTLLAVLRETTGMRCAAVVRVADDVQIVCAVQDELNRGIETGAPLVLGANLATASQSAHAPVLVERASTDPTHTDAAGSKECPIETCISAPIFLPTGRYFGTLCAFDSRALTIPGPVALSMLTRFAALIASQLQQHFEKEHEHLALLDERAAGELRDQFIAILGHDLRSPLQAIYASSDMLQRKLADPDLSAYVGRIRTNVRRMSALIDDVLDFARGRLGGGIAVELTEVQSVNTGLSTVIQEHQDAQPGCKILSSIGVDRSVRCDLGRLQQVASNLLANALTHGRADTPVRFTATTDETHLILEVWNAGKPIPAESIGKIFQPFWRHSVSSSRNGLGLGLHICSQIVRAHEGDISVTSTAAEGTLFTARMPLSSPPTTELSSRRPLSEPATQRSAPPADPALRAQA